MDNEARSAPVAVIALELGGAEHHVLERGVAMCAKLGLEPTVVYVLDYDEALPRSSEMMKQTREFLHHACAELGADVHEEVIRGHGASALCARAEGLGASLILLGSNQRHGARRLLFGDFTQRVISLARCDVFVIGHESARAA